MLARILAIQAWADDWVVLRDNGRVPVRLVLAAVMLAAGWFSLSTAREDPGFSFAGSGVTGTVALLGAAGALAGAGWLLLGASRGRRTTGLLFLGAALGWLLGEWDNPGSASSWQFSIGLALSAVTPALLAHAVLAFPAGLRGWWERWLVASGYLSTVLLIGVLPSTSLSISASGCLGCPRNLWLVHADVPRALEQARWGLGAATAWALLTSATLLWKVMRSSTPRRRVTAGIELAGAAHLIVTAGTFAISIRPGFVGSTDRDRLLWLASAGLQVLLAALVAVDLLRTARLRQRLAGLVLDLDRAGPAGDIDAALAAMLGTRPLIVAYPTETGLYVDLEGQPLAVLPSSGRGQLSLAHEGRELAVVTHDGDLFVDPDLVGRSLHLSLQNAGLRAQTAHQLHELQASRVRIVEAGDVERRRLEHDLHDGGQQRIVSLLYALRLIATGNDLPTMGEAIQEVQSAIDELRRLAHGIHPILLYDEGLSPALRSLAESPLLRLGTIEEERLPPLLETTLYQIIERAVTQGPTSVEERRSRDQVEMEISVEASFLDLGALEDRVAAVGGTVTRSTAGGRCQTVIRLPIPG